MSSNSTINLDTSKIRSWRSIVTLIVFVLTNLAVLFPTHWPIWIPRILVDVLLRFARWVRLIPHPRPSSPLDDIVVQDFAATATKPKTGLRIFLERHCVRYRFPLNFITAPLLADLFLLAILAIGREEVRDGTVGANNIFPIDIMAFFITLAYIAISIDASGLIRYLAFKVLQRGGKNGHRLFLYLYSFFFLLAGAIGNDPVILSGTAFLAYMTRISENISHPRAWIHTQFAAANIGSAILVSSNPTNLVLAGAFNIKFVNYTANIIVPVIVTAVTIPWYLLYIVDWDPNKADNNRAPIPKAITLHELQDSQKGVPVNPNIPNVRTLAEEKENIPGEDSRALSLEEVMNPFLDKKGAAVGAVIMTVTLVTILALNAATDTTHEHPVFWVTLPAAFLLLLWDLGSGWVNRKETREIARKTREDLKNLVRERERRASTIDMDVLADAQIRHSHATSIEPLPEDEKLGVTSQRSALSLSTSTGSQPPAASKTATVQLWPSAASEKPDDGPLHPSSSTTTTLEHSPTLESQPTTNPPTSEPTTLVSLISDAWQSAQETFPTVTAVLGHLPYALIPFALCMFVLVQALVTKGWVPVFAYGWDRWVNKTGTIGAIGGMGFLSVVLCNFAGTNIGTTILLCRVIQAWVEIHNLPSTTSPLSQRTFWATVYAMALGVNYGAFSTAFSASLAGLLWRDILARKHIVVHPAEFARYNLRIIAFAMVVGCAVLIGEVYIVRRGDAYVAGSAAVGGG